MIAPPKFSSNSEFVSCLSSADFWRPFVMEILERHDLICADCVLEAGSNATYPTFLCGDVVIKLFGHSRSWQVAYEAEHAALSVVAADPKIAAPRLVGSGRLCDDADASWQYLIMTRVPGVASQHVRSSHTQRLAVAKELGNQVQRIHALSPTGVATEEDWPGQDIAEAAKVSSLPPHLVNQIDDYMDRIGPPDLVFTHSDLCANHIYVENGDVVGIIDWGDAMIADRHYELIQVYRDMFDCDKELFKTFLSASNWPLTRDFLAKTLAGALRRQAIGLVQHRTMDVFEPIAKHFPLNDIDTLDQLSIELFAI